MALSPKLSEYIGLCLNAKLKYAALWISIAISYFILKSLECQNCFEPGLIIAGKDILSRLMKELNMRADPIHGVAGPSHPSMIFPVRVTEPSLLCPLC